jgi:hypothetical protein
MSNGVNIKFDDPIYLEPGWYALTIGSQSSDYYLFTAKGGNKVLGNLSNPTWGGIGSSLSKQAHDGVLFLSYNNTTWETDLSRDLMFQLNKAVFNTSSVGNVSLSVSGVNFPIHEFVFSAVTKVPLGSMLKSYYDVGSGNTSFRIEDYDSQNSNDVVPINVGTNANKLNINMSLSTLNSDVAPCIYLNKWGVVTWQYASSGSYYSQQVNLGQTFSNIKLWIDEIDNNGSVVYKASFDNGVTWYNLPVITSASMSNGWTENELGGQLSSVTNNAVTSATTFIVRADLTCSSNNLWLSPRLSALRVLVY